MHEPVCSDLGAFWELIGEGGEVRFLVDLGLGKGEDDGSGLRCSRGCVVACASSHLLLCELWPGSRG